MEILIGILGYLSLSNVVPMVCLNVVQIKEVGLEQLKVEMADRDGFFLE